MMQFIDYTFHSKSDTSTEAISKIQAPSRLVAARYFAQKKNLSLKEFLKLYSVSK